MASSGSINITAMKSLLDVMLALKNYPNQMDESLHGSWANQNGDKVEDTEARAEGTAARAPTTEPAPVRAEPKKSVWSDYKKTFKNSAIYKGMVDEHIRLMKLRATNPDYQNNYQKFAEDYENSTPYKDIYDKYRGTEAGPNVADAAIMARKMGYDSKPEVFNSADLDNFVNNGEIEMWRGVSNPEHFEEFRYSDTFFMGDGRSSVGMYTATDYADDPDYEGEVGYVYAQGYGNAIMRMTLKEGSKIGDYAQIFHQCEKKYFEIYEKDQQLHLRPGYSRGYSENDEPVWVDKDGNEVGDDVALRSDAELTEDEQRQAAELNVDLIMATNPSMMAMALGYDALFRPDLGHILVLNRGAVRVDKQTYDGKDRAFLIQQEDKIKSEKKTSKSINEGMYQITRATGRDAQDPDNLAFFSGLDESDLSILTGGV